MCIHWAHFPTLKTYAFEFVCGESYASCFSRRAVSEAGLRLGCSENTLGSLSRITKRRSRQPLREITDDTRLSDLNVTGFEGRS